ncbi:hypothetical protein [Saccharopolyspora hattusasensis]|uniref:hypothetical protein n=1 Tax=Saccharopolyspora hattusasensis TaxID=1128679 RepID=UPI003D99BE9C
MGFADGPHARFAEKHGRVLRYSVDVAPFLAIPDECDVDGWRDDHSPTTPSTFDRRGRGHPE